MSRDVYAVYCWILDSIAHHGQRGRPRFTYPSVAGSRWRPKDDGVRVVDALAARA